MKSTRREPQHQTTLRERLQGDELASMLVTLMSEGLSTPRDLADATGRSPEDIRGARRRIRYQADEVTQELSQRFGEEAPRARAAARDEDREGAARSSQEDEEDEEDEVAQ